MIVSTFLPFLRDMLVVLRVIRVGVNRTMARNGRTEPFKFKILLFNELTLLCNLLLVGYEGL
jgi:hypothetical protein